MDIESEEMSMEEALKMIKVARAELLEIIPVITKEMESLAERRNELQVKFEESLKPIDERMKVIKALLKEAGFPIIAPVEGEVVVRHGVPVITSEIVRPEFLTMGVMNPKWEAKCGLCGAIFSGDDADVVLGDHLVKETKSIIRVCIEDIAVEE